MLYDIYPYIIGSLYVPNYFTPVFVRYKRLESDSSQNYPELMYRAVPEKGWGYLSTLTAGGWGEGVGVGGGVHTPTLPVL